MSSADPLYSALLRRIEQLEQLLRANFLRSASVSRGITEWRDDSELRITDSNLNVVGTATIFGTLRTVGRIILEGLGILTVNGLIELFGRMQVRGGGGITVEDGGDIVVDGGEIRAGDVVIKDGKAHIGGMVLDPTEHGGAVTFPNGAQVFTDADTIQVFKGNSVAQVSNDYARIQHGGDVVQIDGDGIRMSPGSVPVAEEGDNSGHWMKINPTTGRLTRVPPGIGGPEGGAFEYPFPESTISDTFRPPNRPTHNGLDFAGPEVTGHMIPSAARGVVTFSGGSPTVTPTSGYGYYVVVSHGMINGHSVETWYAHMATTPPVSEGQTVAKGDLLGPVGNTGNSFGDHLHWEIHVDGEPVDPQVFMQQFAS